MQQVLEVPLGPEGGQSSRRSPAAGSPPAGAPLARADLPEGLLLAALSDDGYAIPSRRVLATGLAAATIVELGFRQRLCIDGGRLLVTDRTPSGHAVADPVLEALTLRRRAPQVERCLEDLSLDWTILGRAGYGLEARGLVRIERRALHPLIMHRFHPLPSGGAAGQRAALRAVLDGTHEAAPRALALASLAAAAGLLREGRTAAAETGAGPSAAARTLDHTAAGEVLAAARPVLAACVQGRRPEAAAVLGARPA